jgi:hypothetical protein
MASSHTIKRFYRAFSPVRTYKFCSGPRFFGHPFVVIRPPRTESRPAPL